MYPQPHDRFAEVFRALLKARGLSQRQAAILLRVSDSQVSRWQHGRGGISLENVERIAIEFGQDREQLAQLAGLRDNNPATTLDAFEAERQQWGSWYQHLLDAKVPKAMWTAYTKACEALADVFSQSDPGQLNVPESPSLSDSPAKNNNGSLGPEMGDFTKSSRPSRSTYGFATLSAGAAG